MKLATVATCNLNQWALDFTGNLARIIRSIEIAKAAGATLRIGPELEIPGYGCEDHFLESDTILHSWEALAELLLAGGSDGIICDVGMPVVHKDVRYNCRVLCLDRRVLLIRPKLYMCDDGNYRETRYFTPWRKLRQVEDHYLPGIIREISGQETVPIGDGVLATLDTCIGCETCEELFTPRSPHIDMSLDGVEIIANGSGSHHNLRKLTKRLDLIRGGTAKTGGIYMYANQIGCDGGRLYFDGCAMICVNGEVVALGDQFSMDEVSVITARVDLEQVRSFRGAVASRSSQAASTQPFPRVFAAFKVAKAAEFRGGPSPALPLPLPMCDPMQEIARGPACWLWDYLRRSGLSGFFLPLSGGADSTTVAAIVGSMCQLLIQNIQAGNEQVLVDLRKVVRVADDWIPKDPQEIAGLILHTCYMGTVNSSADTRDRAARIAGEIGAYHMNIRIDSIVDAFIALFTAATQKVPRFRLHGGTTTENLALQNIQARTRMVTAYLLAQLLPWVRGRGNGLLVLGSANVDEALRGYYTKYDCSAADLNPIGSISKQDLRSFMRWASTNLGYPSMVEVVEAPPTAELEPSSESYQQTDEDDMGMSYDELSVYGRLRKLSRLGPFSMFCSLLRTWGHLPPQIVAEKVKHFFRMYAINRHKMTTLTPSYHAEAYSPDDNRHDLRQFLYNASWPWQFKRIDKYLESVTASTHE